MALADANSFAGLNSCCKRLQEAPINPMRKKNNGGERSPRGEGICAVVQKNND